VSPWKRRRRQDDPTEPLCQELVEDCEAFLGGRLVETLEVRKVPVPTWAWMNLLAHGSMEELRLASLEERTRRGDDYWEWRKSRSYLATLILASARPFGPLLALHQEAALIPLELMLAARPEPCACTPTDWVARVEAVLRFHRDTLRALNLDIDPNPEKGERQ
jgi:hypothetical protein